MYGAVVESNAGITRQGMVIETLADVEYVKRRYDLNTNDPRGEALKECLPFFMTVPPRCGGEERLSDYAYTNGFDLKSEKHPIPLLWIEVGREDDEC